jgi:hypothetical protein
MKLALHATEPATRQSPLPQLIEYDLVELISGIEALRVPAATGRTKLWVGHLSSILSNAPPSESIVLLICCRESSACLSI